MRWIDSNYTPELLLGSDFAATHTTTVILFHFQIHGGFLKGSLWSIGYLTSLMSSFGTIPSDFMRRLFFILVDRAFDVFVVMCANAENN